MECIFAVFSADCENRINVLSKKAAQVRTHWRY